MASTRNGRSAYLWLFWQAFYLEQILLHQITLFMTEIISMGMDYIIARTELITFLVTLQEY